MRIVNTVVSNSDKPFACLYRSFGYRPCKIPGSPDNDNEACGQKSMRKIDHSKACQLLYDEQAELAKTTGPNGIKQLLTTSKVKHFFRNLFPASIVTMIDNM